MAFLTTPPQTEPFGTALQAVSRPLQTLGGRQVENPSHRVSPQCCRWFRPVFWFSLTCALLLVGTASLRAQPADSGSKTAIQAGYLHTFTKYTEWPTNVFSNTNAPIVIGVLGDDPFGSILDQSVTNRTSQERKVVVRRARDVKALLDCQVVFISRSEKARLPGILATLRQAPVLTVCDEDAFFQQGVMIKYSLVKDRVHFEVKLDPAERAGIKFGSGMLGSAKRVWPKSGGEIKRP